MSMDQLRDAVRKAGLGVTAAGGLAFAEDAYASCIGGCKNTCQTCTNTCTNCNPEGSACKTTVKDVNIDSLVRTPHPCYHPALFGSTPQCLAS